VVQFLGVAALLLALLLLASADWHLGGRHAVRGSLLEGQPLIESGPYRFIRHPIFAASILLAAGLFAVNPSFITALMLVYGAWNAYQSALRDERRLSADLPGYAAYMSRTGRFLPRWRRQG
jgi:protein-S-isoprenylcysteine O-methyltransferase Ste14